ncbi:MAG: hypothetical protein V2A77_07225 [Pseudomonadota bacterium]
MPGIDGRTKGRTFSPYSRDHASSGLLAAGGLVPEAEVVELKRKG